VNAARAGTAPARRPAEERGRLEIAPVVLRRIAEYAADQVPGTLRHGRRLAGIDVGEVGAVAKVHADAGETGLVDVALELTLQYPAVIRSVVAAVRERVGTDLDRMAGYRLRAFTVTVSGLRDAAPVPVTRIQ
jgi:uncharacterized alkaline shock family protein YloU